MYCADNGRPNRAVQTVLGVHLLKEMFNLTDGEALEQLEFNLLWHHALRLDIEETHLPQKTLHNFRVRLMQHDGGRLAFQETTDRIIQALGIRTGKQRLDSTHIMSNIATLTRLGLFCETMRLFLRALRWEHPELRPVVPEGLLGRYLKEEDEATHYEDAHTGEGRRRLSVCARDLYRLVDRFRGTTAAQLEEYRLLERLNAPVGDLVEIANPQGAPLRSWVRIIQKDGPTNPICYLGPTGRKILRLEDGANAEVRRLDFEPVDVARSVLPYSSRYDGLP